MHTQYDWDPEMNDWFKDAKLVDEKLRKSAHDWLYNMPTMGFCYQTGRIFWIDKDGKEIKSKENPEWRMSKVKCVSVPSDHPCTK